MKAGWQQKRLKFVAPSARQILPARPAGSRYVGLENIESGTGRMLLETEQDQVDSSVVAFSERSVLFGKLRPYLAKVALPDFSGVASTEIMVFEPAQKNDRRFLFYSLLSDEFIKRVSGMVDGAKMPRANPDDILDLCLAVPSSIEQQRIAAYLDSATGKIDRLMSLRRWQMELLREQRAALIQQAVTRGLNPSAPLKDSGLPWLSQIPKHWQLLKLRRVTLSRCDGPFGSGLKSETYVSNGVRVIRLQNIRCGSFNDDDRAFIDPDYYKQLGDHDVLPGDVLIAGLGDDKNPVGRACVAPETIGPAMVKADCFRFRLNTLKANPSFVAIQLSCVAAAQDGAFASGTTRQRINLTETASREIALPPPDEQGEILAYIQRETAKLDGLHRSYERQLELLAGYRASLIHECVTGQRPVPN